MPRIHLDTPFRKISLPRCKICCYTDIHIRNKENAGRFGRTQSGEKGFRFQGILKFLERNFEESNSDSYREWMTQYMSATLCSACHGSG